MKRAGQQETENTRTASIYSRVETNRQGFFKGFAVGDLMRKALAQNPNLLRTLLGLSFTLIFMLSYAVYGATVSPSYYLYETELHYFYIIFLRLHKYQPKFGIFVKLQISKLNEEATTIRKQD